MYQSIILTIVVCTMVASGQLTYKTDQFTNSFSVKTPSSQQTFTRYFGGSGGQSGNLFETAETRQQQQQVYRTFIFLYSKNFYIRIQ